MDTITKAELEVLPAETQAKFKDTGDGVNFTLGEVEDVGALKRALDRTRLELKDERELKAQAEAKKAEEIALIKATADKEALEKAEKSGDYKAINLDLQSKLEASKAQLEEQQNLITGEKIKAAESQLYSEFGAKSPHPALMTAYIKANSKVGISEDGTAKVTFLDANGQPTADTKDDFMQKMLANDETKAILAPVSKGSGSGAVGSGAGSGASRNVKFSELSTTDKVSRLKETGAVASE